MPKRRKPKIHLLVSDGQEQIEKAKDYISKVENIARDPATFVYEYFEDLKRDVDLRREVLKAKIDEKSEEIIQSIESTQKECMELASKVTEMTQDIENSQRELDHMAYKLMKLKWAKHNLSKDMHRKTFEFSEGTNQMLEKYKASLLSFERKVHSNMKENTQDYLFVSIDRSISGLFGNFGVFSKVKL